ncbi:MAG: DNA-directed RNA polymerase subunit A' [Candidatus Lokiarchaeota archaeon]|nr:DNA-directed RNA polymerase subunit A' [Candidatus Lokiarchaeota archaeon]
MALSGISRVIDKIKFGLLSPDEIRKMSATRIITADTYDDDGLPLASGLMDQKLGTIEPGQKCTTCGNRVGQCLGHFGHIELARPVVHVGFAKLLLKLLRSICPECSRLLLSEDQFEDFKKRKEQQVRVFENVSDVLIQNIFKTARKTKQCPYCGAERKKITIEKPTTYYEEVGLDQPRRLYPDDIRERLEKMNDADCRLLEINPEATRPEWMILTVLPIPPVCVRPSITLDSGIRSEDDLTHKLVDVIRINARLRENIEAGAPQLIVEDLWELLQYHITTFFNNEVSGIPPARHRSGRALRTLTQRLKGKEGRFRSNLSGKRVDFSARTVISPNPHISINEVGVPEIIAKILTVPNHVTEWNIEDMKQLIINGPDKHPGANYIIRTDSRRIDLRYVKDRSIIADTVEPGYIVERHLKNKDLVLFNRQPSLHRMSIMAHEVRIMTGKTFQLALLVCTPYNADFDGDEMNLHVPQSEEARAEAQFLLKVQEHILSPRYGGPIIGGVHDFISLAYIFTRKSSLFDKNTTYQLLEWGNVFQRNPEFKLSDLKPETTDPEPLYSGKAIFSTILPKDLNMQLKSNFCQKCKDGCKEEDCEFDAYVNIVNGELISGVLDEKTYGAGKPTTILLRITKDYGPDAARKFLDDSASMLLYFIMHHALTMGLDEVDITSIMPKINEVMAKANQQCDTYIKAFYENDEETMPCAPGRTYKETLELRIREVLNKARDEAGKIGAIQLGDSAHSVIMTKSGARGNPLNLTQMAACVGQQAVRGDRIHRGFSDRTLPHFKVHDLTARARGFVESSYRKGLDPIEFFFHAMGGREGLVDTAVRTSSSGYMQRRLVNALQDMVVQNDGTVRTSTDNIIQFVYGDDRVDPAKSDHGEAVNVKNIFLKAKNMYEYFHYEKEVQERKFQRLEEEGKLTKEIKKQQDLIENYEPVFDAEVKFPKKTEPKSSKKKTEKKKTVSKKASEKAKKMTSTKKESERLEKEETESKYTDEYFHKLYNEETGKTAIWRGSLTQIFLKWLEKKKEELGVK